MSALNSLLHSNSAANAAAMVKQVLSQREKAVSAELLSSVESQDTVALSRSASKEDRDAPPVHGQPDAAKAEEIVAESAVEQKNPFDLAQLTLSDAPAQASASASASSAILEALPHNIEEKALPGEQASEMSPEDAAWWEAYRQEQPVKPMEEVFSPEQLEVIDQLQAQQDEHALVKCTDSKQKQLAKDYAGDGAPKKEKKLHIVMGLSGSGKSSIIVGDLQRKGEGAFLVDSDEIKKLIPGYKQGQGAQAVHSASASIATKCLREAIKRGDNIIYPTVGSKTNGLIDLIQRAKDQGYTVKLHLAHLPPEVAAKRVFRRMAHAVEHPRQSFQFVHPRLPLQDGYTPKENFETLKIRPDVDGSSIWDTEREGGKLMKPVS